VEKVEGEKETETSNKEPAEQWSDANVSRHRKVMILEDEKTLSEIYRQIIEREGHSVVIVAKTAKEALSKFNQAQSAKLGEDGQPEILIADNRLPDGLGIEVSKELLRLNPKLKIILATADESVTDQTATEAGIAQVLRKPFDTSSLLSSLLTVSKTLEKTRTLEVEEAARRTSNKDY
jgi:CheY-like chemotaxis protein